MPGGSGPLLPQQWQPVPGCRDALIYPFIRKVDTVSSNSYLVRTPDVVILIDPGGLPEQAALPRLDHPREQWSVGRAARRDTDPCSRRPLPGRALRPSVRRPGNRGDRGPGVRGRGARVRRSPADAGRAAGPRDRPAPDRPAPPRRGGRRRWRCTGHAYVCKRCGRHGRAEAAGVGPSARAARHRERSLARGLSHARPQPGQLLYPDRRPPLHRRPPLRCKSGHRGHLRMEPGGVDPIPCRSADAPLLRRYRGGLPRARADALGRRRSSHARRRSERRPTPDGHRGTGPGPRETDRRICRGLHGAGERDLHRDGRAALLRLPCHGRARRVRDRRRAPRADPRRRHRRPARDLRRLQPGVPFRRVCPAEPSRSKADR